MDDVRTPQPLSDTTKSLLVSLNDLLDKERSTLLDGDLDGISRTLREKERLMDGLNATGVTGNMDMRELKEKLIRNQVLLDGALEGIRAVADRISALRRIRSTLETYDQSGRKMTIEAQRVTQVEKRA